MTNKTKLKAPKVKLTQINDDLVVQTARSERYLSLMVSDLYDGQTIIDAGGSKASLNQGRAAIKKLQEVLTSADKYLVAMGLTL